MMLNFTYKEYYIILLEKVLDFTTDKHEIMSHSEFCLHISSINAVVVLLNEHNFDHQIEHNFIKF